MRVAVYTQFTPWGFYRLIWPAMVLQQYGFDVDIFVPDQDSGNPFRMVPDDNGRAQEFSVPDYDVIVMQRVTEEHRVAAIRTWQRHGKRVVIDMDDNLDAIDPAHNPGAWDALHTTPDVSHRWTAEACRLADMVTASTPALVDKYGHRNSKRTLLRNCVPSAFLKIPRYDGTLSIIGWSGAVKFRTGDPGVVGDALARLQADGHEFGVVGPVDEVQSAFSLARPPYRHGSQRMDVYPLALARHTVGIAPLKRTTFNHAKSWLKPLEFLSLGVPVVASDLPEYEALSAGKPDHGVFYARNPDEWYGLLSRLLTDDTFREEQSARGRDLVRELTYENHAYLWWKAWTGLDI